MTPPPTGTLDYTAGDALAAKGTGTANTMLATSSNDDTLIAADGQGPGQDGRTKTFDGRATMTVLPEVRTDGNQLVLQARDERRYEREKLLGRGGMGEVELATDQDIGRRVAVKKMLDEQPHSVARFVDEVRTVGALEHPNIVPIHDVGVDENGALFFVMKYVEGDTLSDIIERLAAGDPTTHRQYGFERRLEIFAALVRALQYAHSRGLVHRDVKPENLMIGRYGEVILMDWGIAHRIRSDERLAGIAQDQLGDRASAETVDGAVVGTPRYMSPEQIAGLVAQLDGRSDLYSAFVLLYELLTLKPLVEDGKTAAETLVRAQERPVPAYTAPEWDHPHQPAVPAELRHFVWHGLQKEADARFQDAADVLSQLERIRAGDIKVECPITFMKHNNHRMENFMDSHPALSLWMLFGTGLAFVGGLAGWVMWALA